MKMPAQINLSRRRRLPVTLAAEGAECGLACLAMVAAYHGHDVDLNGLRQRFSLSLSGASLRSLMGFANSLGFGTRALRVDSARCTGCACPPSSTGTSITSWCSSA
jgi:ATP-binding cassette, subfamily B, bacterial CvaB/MchF/RaxB